MDERELGNPPHPRQPSSHHHHVLIRHQNGQAPYGKRAQIGANLKAPALKTESFSKNALLFFWVFCFRKELVVQRAIFCLRARVPE